MNNDKKRALIYTRVSHEEQVKYGYSLDAQRESLQQYCHDNNYTIIAEYTDEGISGGEYKKRKGFVKMISDAQPGDTILFTKLDRFSRNLLDANLIVQDLDAKSVSIKAIAEDDIDTTTADGRFIFNLKLSLAQREREKTAERVRDVMKYKGERGELTSGTVPLGYKIENKKAVIDEETKDIAIFIFETYDRTNNLQATYRAMVEKYGRVRCVSSMKNILKSRTYIGLNAYNKPFCEPLIDTDTFNRVQTKLSKNIKKTPTNNVYLFSRLIVCPVCGKRLYAHGYSDYKKYIYYHCASRNLKYGGKCGFAYAREDKIEEQLLNRLQLFAEQKLYQFKRTDVEQHESQIKKLEQKLERLKDLYIDGDIDKTTYNERKRRFESDLTKLRQLTHANGNEALNEIMSLNIKELYLTLNKANRQAVWHRYIEAIIINKDAEIVDVVFCK